MSVNITYRLPHISCIQHQLCQQCQNNEIMHDTSQALAVKLSVLEWGRWNVFGMCVCVCARARHQYISLYKCFFTNNLIFSLSTIWPLIMPLLRRIMFVAQKQSCHFQQSTMKEMVLVLWSPITFLINI